MTHIVQKEVVHYACTCGLLKPISKLYYCRHCLELRCGFCVCNEVDSLFCVKCTEIIPSSEARLKKNRCANCYDCPSCQQQLSTRIAPSSRASEDMKDGKPSTPRKLYYLSCYMCRWNSRDVGIPDQSVATGGWPERENVNATRLNEIQDMYKSLVLQEKQQKIDKDKKKQFQRGKYLTLTEKTGLTSAVLRKRLGLSETSPKSLLPSKLVEPSVAKDDVEELPIDILTKEINLIQITTLEQRLLQPEWQPEAVDKLFPVHKNLNVKKSQRCRSCEHNVCKPEYYPNSIKFKIQLFAYYHIPEVRIVTTEPLRAGKPSELMLKFCNPTQHQTTLQFFLLDMNDESVEVVEEEKPKEEEEPAKSEEVMTASAILSRQQSLVIKPRKITRNLTSQMQLPTSSVILPPRDDAAEYDDSTDTHSFQDDPKLVFWRKSNKAVLKFQVTPNSDLGIGEEVVAGFTMQHLYTNTIATTENKEPQVCEHKVKVFLTLGNLVGSS